MLNAQQVIKQLNLQTHPIEGGYFKRTYTVQQSISVANNQQRHLMSSIYYLLDRESNKGYLHKNKSDIIHYFHAGSALRYWIVGADNRLKQVVLGHDIAAGQQLQLLVKAGCWKASELCHGNYDYALISEAVSPSFDYRDNTIATFADIQTYSDKIQLKLAKFLAKR